jgi:hypothetical protein
VVKASWEELKKAFILEFQSKESYQSLLGSLSSVRQQPQKSVCTYSEWVRKLQASIKKCVSRGGVAGVGGTPVDLMATLLGTSSLMLRSFVYGLLLVLQEVVAFVNPPSFDEALALAQRKQESLSNIVTWPRPKCVLSWCRLQ